MQTLETPTHRTLLHVKYFPSCENIRPNASRSLKKIKEHSRVYIPPPLFPAPRNGVKLRKAMLTWIQALRGGECDSCRRHDDFDMDCIDVWCAFRKSILSLKRSARRSVAEKMQHKSRAPFSPLKLLYAHRSDAVRKKKSGNFQFSVDEKGRSTEWEGEKKRERGESGR